MLYSFESPVGLLERFPAEGIFQKEWTLRKGNMGWRKPVRKGGSPETAEGIRTVGKKLHFMWGCSSAGRAPALQAGGQEFDSPHLHQRGGSRQAPTRTKEYGLIAQAVRARA